MARVGEMRQRVLPPASIAAFVLAGAGGLAALQVEAGGSRPEFAEPGRDPLTVTYLGAFVAGQPKDAAMRLRLGREQLALGKLAEAEESLVPLLAKGPAQTEALRLSLDISLTAWRAARGGTLERTRAEARARARLKLLSQQDPTLDGLSRAATAAREIGCPDLAARAAQRAAVLDQARCSVWLAAAARDFLAAADPVSAAGSLVRAYECRGDGPGARALALEALDVQVAANMGPDALQFAERLLARYPEDRDILAVGVALALANADPGRARRFATRLRDLRAADEVMLGSLFDLDLAAGDLPGALHTAERLLSTAPADPRFHRMVAQAAEWAGRPRFGLPHWVWLARSGDAAALEHGLRLAHSLEDDASLAELLTWQSRRRPLAAAEVAQLAGALERLGSPGRARSLLEDAARRSEGDDLWQQLIAFHERRRDFSAAIAAYTEMVRRSGPSLARSLELARLGWAAGRPDAALAELGGWSETAGRGQTEYWKLLAELAWRQESDDLAARALGALWRDGQIEAVGAERLIILSHEAGRHADAIRYGREGWARLREPRLLLLAMEEAAHAGLWGELGQLRIEAARNQERFAGSVPYWLLCAQVDRRAGRIADAARDYRRALVVDRGSAAARNGLIWLFIESDDRNRLATALAAWAADAEDDPRLWQAYAAGFERLGRMREAVAFYRREADADPDDQEARARYLAAVARAAPKGAPARSTVLTAELGATALGPVMLQRFGAAARTWLGNLELDVRAASISVSDEGPMPMLDRDAVDVRAGAAVTALGGRTELQVGAGLKQDRSVLQAALAHTRVFARRGQARVEAAVNELASETPVLSVGAVRTRAGGSLALGSERLFGRAAGEWKSWSSWSGIWLGRGGAGTLELGVRARLADPEFTVRLQGGYQRNQLGMLVPGAPILPDELATVGMGMGAARWKLGPARLLLDAWLGWVVPPLRPAYRFQAGFAVERFAGAELSLAGYAANDNWVMGRGELGMTASLAYRFPSKP